MIWLIIYVVLSLLTFVALAILETIIVRHVRIIRLIVMSVFFPFTWIAFVISIIVNR